MNELTVGAGTVRRVVHCDWGTRPKKRRMAIADRLSNGSWRAAPIELVGPLGTLLTRARTGVTSEHSVLSNYGSGRAHST